MVVRVRLVSFFGDLSSQATLVLFEHNIVELEEREFLLGGSSLLLADDSFLLLEWSHVSHWLRVHLCLAFSRIIAHNLLEN